MTNMDSSYKAIVTAAGILAVTAILAIGMVFITTGKSENLNLEKRSKDVEFDNILLSSYCPHVPDVFPTQISRSSSRGKKHIFNTLGEEWNVKYREVMELSGSGSGMGGVEDENLDWEKLLNIHDLRHHDNEELLEILQNVTETCSEVSRMYTIGKTTAGKDIWVIEFTENPGRHELLKPEFRYVANIHGNEVTGRELTLQLSKELCVGYMRKDPDIVSLLSSTRIHIVPSLNPDGYEIAQKYAKWKHWTLGRFNWNGIDLNRNFPDLNDAILPFSAWKTENDKLLGRFVRGRRKSSLSAKITGGFNDDGVEDIWGYNVGCARGTFDKLRKSSWQSETKAAMQWMASIPFVMSVSFHDGGVGAFYPFDKAIPGQWEARTPDDDLVRQLATTYATNHEDMSDKSMANTDPWCRYKGGDYRRQGGVANGASWFGITGSMEDYSYTATNCFGIVVETACEKLISEYKLPSEWRKNKKAMFRHMEQAHMGIKGIVTDKVINTPLEGAIVHIRGIFRDVVTTESGEYWRPLLPGKYKVQARYASIFSEVIEIEVTNENRFAAQIVNLEL